MNAPVEKAHSAQDCVMASEAINAKNKMPHLAKENNTSYPLVLL